MSRKNRWMLLAVAILICMLAGCEKKEQGSEITVNVIEPMTLKTMEPLAWKSEEDTNLADLMQRAGSGACVCIEAGGLAGSGLIYEVYDRQLLVVTAAHVLEQVQDTVFVTFADGTHAFSRNYRVYEEQELAMIAVDCDQLSEEQVRGYGRLLVEPAKFEACVEGDTCITMGGSEVPGGEAYEGSMLAAYMYLEDYDSVMTVAEGVCEPGMSGGGLFDSRGYFLGILSGFDESGRIAVVPLPTVQETVQDYLTNS